MICGTEIDVLDPSNTSPRGVLHLSFLLSNDLNIILGTVRIVYFCTVIILVPVAARSKARFCSLSPAETVGSNPPGAWKFVCCECCVLSGRCRCEGLSTPLEESYRLWCVVVYDLGNSKN